MKSKILNSLLILTSLLGYLEWGKDMHTFLFNIEAELLSKSLIDPISVLHPLTVLPMIGQLLLLVSLFQKNQNKILSYIGIAALGLLLGFIFIAGCMSKNFKIIISTIPFLVTSYLAIRHYRNS